MAERRIRRAQRPLGYALLVAGVATLTIASLCGLL